MKRGQVAPTQKYVWLSAWIWGSDDVHMGGGGNQLKNWRSNPRSTPAIRALTINMLGNVVSLV